MSCARAPRPTIKRALGETGGGCLRIAGEVGGAQGGGRRRRPASRGPIGQACSEALGAIARVDLVELDGRRAVPVDYQRGAVPDTEQRAQDPERVQLCLQGLLLCEAGYGCDHGVLCSAESKTRVEVPFDPALEAMTRDAVAGLRRLVPARDDRQPL